MRSSKGSGKIFTKHKLKSEKYLRETQTVFAAQKTRLFGDLFTYILSDEKCFPGPSLICF